MYSQTIIDFVQKNAPCYIYDQATIRKQASRLQQTFGEATLLFSLKTNPFVPVVRFLASLGFGADAASAGEVALAASCGMPAEKIYYSTPGKTQADITACLGKCHLIADSMQEIIRAEQAAKEAGKTIGIGIRVNPAFSMDSDMPAPSKFGMDEEQLHRVFALLSECPHLKIEGLHVHLRSQILDALMLANYYEKCYALAEKVSLFAGHPLSYINFGSGIAIPYYKAEDSPLDLAVLSQAFSTLAERNKNALAANLLIETGRFVTCESGTYFTPIVDKKTSCGKTFLIVEKGMNGFFRPAQAALLEQLLEDVPNSEPLYTRKNAFPISVVGIPQIGAETVTIAGSLCTALDVLAKDISLPMAPVGAIIAVGNAGSYGRSLSPLTFSSHPAPPEFLYTEENTFVER